MTLDQNQSLAAPKIAPQPKLRWRRKLFASLWPHRVGALEKLNEAAEFVNFANRNSRAIVGPKRQDVWRHIHRGITGPITYLEFGVFEGESIRFWSTQDKHPESRFVGFDRFEGLPHDWHGNIKKGHFDTGGRIPVIDDPRVSFIKGDFQDTLRPFLASLVVHGTLVVHCDADLYSATLYVLATLDHILLRSTYVMFDEFADLAHEWSAFHDYLAACNRKYDVVCATEDFDKVAIKIA